MIKWAYLLVGGGVGATARYILSGVIHQLCGTNFPYGTFVVNLTGCFFIGFLSVIMEEKFLLSPNLRLLLMVGFFGAFTTFSTFIMEISHLIRDGETWLAFINILCSVIIGFLLFRIGIFLAEAI